MPVGELKTSGMISGSGLAQKGLVDQIERLITIKGNVTEAQRDRMLQIADMCPVHKTLMNQKEITSRYAN